MATQRQIKFGIGFNVDTSGLNTFKQAVESLSHISTGGFEKTFTGPKEELKQIQTTIGNVKTALQNSFDVKLNTINLTNFQNQLKQSNTSIRDFGNACAKAGAEGQQAFNAVAHQILATKTHVREAHTLMDKMMTTFTNTLRWTVASSAIQMFTSAIRNSVTYVKELDSTLNDIRVVTGKSADDMDIFAQKANKAAAALGKTTKDYTTAALLFYQQGLSDQEVEARTNVTLKASNVTGQDTKAVSEELTAIWNGYKVSAAETEEYIDKVAAVAASTASNLEELSTAMSKVASSANAMGVDIDQLNAQLSTIISVTRQDAGIAGTALKTIYARMTDIESGLDTETTLGRYTAEMAKFGIQVIDAKGSLRDVGSVMEEIGGKWANFSREQQVALAQAMAGTRQYNNLMALFNNWDMYTKSLETSRNALGTLQEQQDIYYESVEAHLNTVKASAEKLYSTILDSDSFKTVLDVLSNILDSLSNMIDALGGGGNLLLLLGSFFITKLAPTIATSLTTTIVNLQHAKKEGNDLRAALNFTKELETNKSQLDVFNSTLSAIAQLAARGLISKEDAERIKADVEAARNLNIEVAESKKRLAELAQQRQDVVKQATNVNDPAKQKAFNTINSLSSTGVDFSAIRGEDVQASTLALENFGQAATDIDNELRVLTEETNNFTKTQKDALNTIQDSHSGTTKYGNAVDTLTQQIEGVNTSSEKYLHLAKDVLQDNSLTQKVQQAQTEYRQALELVRSDPSQANIMHAKKALLNLQQTEQQVIQAVQNDVQQASAFVNVENDEVVNKTLKGIDKEIQAEQQYTEQKKQEEQERTAAAQQALKDQHGAMKIGIQQYAQAASSLAMVGTSIISLINIFKSFGDESKTTGEKVSGALTSLLMIVPMLISSISSLITSFATLHATLLPILVIVAAVVATAVAIYKAVNADNEALEKAKKTASEAAKQYEKLKKAYDDLKQSLEDYKDAEDALNKLVKGTDEWKEAVQKLNEQVLDLVNTYPELLEYMEIAKDKENGVIRYTLTTEGQEAALDLAQKRAQTAYANQLSAQQAQRRAQTRVSANKLGIDEKTLRNLASRDDLVKLLKTPQGKEELTKLLNNSEYLADSLRKNADAVLQNVQQLKLNAKQDEFASEQAMQSYYTELYGENFAGGYEQEVLATAGKYYQDALAKAQNKYEDKGAFGGGLTDAEIQQQYAAAMGWTVIKNKGDNTAVYADKSGNIMDPIADFVARNYLSTQEAAREAAQKINITETYQGLTSFSQGSIRNAISGMAGGEVASFAALTKNQLKTLQTQAESVTEAQAVALGFKNKKEFTNAVNASIKEYNDGWEKLDNAIENAQVKKLFNDLMQLVDIPLEAANKLNLIYSQLTVEGAQKINELLLIENGKFATDIANIIASTDFSDAFSAFDSFANALIAAGINVFDGYEDMVRGVVTEIRTTTENYGIIAANSLASALKKIDEQYKLVSKKGDTITGEEYNNLGAAAQQYFVKMKDGTYMLTASALEFYNALSQEEKRKKEFELLNESENALKNFEFTTKENFDAANRAAIETREQQNHSEARTNAETTVNALRDRVGRVTLGGFSSASTPENEQILDVIQLARNVFKSDEEQEWLNTFIKSISLREFGFVAPREIATGEDALNQYAGNLLNFNQWFKIGSEKDFKLLLEKIQENLDAAVGIDIEQTISSEYTATNEAEKDKYNSIVQSAINTLGTAIQDAAQRGDLDWAQSLYNERAGIIQSYINGIEDETLKTSYAKQLTDLMPDAEAISKSINNQVQLVSVTDQFNKTIEVQEKKLSLISTLLKNAYGKDALKLLEEQQDAHEKLVEQYKAEYQALEQNQYAEENLRFALANLNTSAALETVKDIDFEDISKLTPEKYKEIVAAMEAELSGMKEGEEKTSWTKAYQDFLEAYDKVLDKNITLADLAQKEIDASLAVVSDKLQKIEVRISVAVDKQQAKKEVNDFIRNVAKDTDIQIKMATTKEDLEELGDVIAKQQDALQKLQEEDLDNEEVREKYMSILKDLYANVEEYQKMITDLEDIELEYRKKINETYQKQISYLQAIYDMQNNLIKASQLLYGEKAYSKLSQFYETQLDMSQRIFAANKKAIEAFDNIDMSNSKEIDEAVSVIQNYAGALSTYMQNLQTYLTNMANTATDAFFTQLSNDENWSKVIDKFNWESEFDNQFMTGVTRELELANNDIAYQRAINNATDMKAKERLISLQKEENALLASKERITKADLDRSQKRLALMQAQIDLENAQNNTSTMRLTRDASGHYTYQYVADENDVLSKMEALNKAQLEYNAAVQTQTKDIIANVSKIQELAASITPENYEEVMEQIRAYFSVMQDQIEGMDLDDTPLGDLFKGIASGNIDDFLSNLETLSTGTKDDMTNANIALEAAAKKLTELAEAGVNITNNDLKSLQDMSVAINEVIKSLDGFKTILGEIAYDDKTGKIDLDKSTGLIQSTIGFGNVLNNYFEGYLQDLEQYTKTSTSSNTTSTTITNSQITSNAYTFGNITISVPENTSAEDLVKGLTDYAASVAADNTTSGQAPVSATPGKQGHSVTTQSGFTYDIK